MSLIRRLAADLTPPIVARAGRRMRPAASPLETPLFGGNLDLFRRVAAKARLYGEYGCGKSTRWMIENTQARIRTVDSDRHWLDEVARLSGAPERLEIIHADIGPTGKWGSPIDFSGREGYSGYTDALWQSDEKPDVVMIDGRFRVCCFLTTLRHAEAGTRVIFDDYVKRRQFHMAAEFLEPLETNGRQALFVTPERHLVDEERLDLYIERFRYVIA